jgi:hypothetical protein
MLHSADSSHAGGRSQTLAQTHALSSGPAQRPLLPAWFCVIKSSGEAEPKSPALRRVDEVRDAL